MTFCLGMNLQGGLVGIADTRVIAGNERITARKVSVFQKERRAMFLMSSGLRSARDKALTRAQRVGPRVGWCYFGGGSGRPGNHGGLPLQ